MALMLLMTTGIWAKDKVYKIQSPTGTLAIEVTAGEELSWAVSRDGVRALEPSRIGLTLEDGSQWGRGIKVRKTAKASVRRTLSPAHYRQEKVQEEYNELTLVCNGYNVVFRAYDGGAAYRFTASQKAPFNVKEELAEFAFGKEDAEAFIPYCRKKSGFDSQFSTPNEAMYTRQAIGAWENGRIAFLPVLVDAPQGMKVCITESDLTNYPGLYLGNDDGNATLEAVHPKYPKDIEQGGHNNLQGIVKSREEFIAKAQATEEFPWRVVIVSGEDKELLTSDIPWLLGKEHEKGADWSWVKPGKVAWDWWNAWNIYGVNFAAGINMDTYKYYIDFASKSGIEYVILDEGWAVNKKADLFQVVPEIDLPALCKYADKKGVGIILWAGYMAFDKDMERACREYSEMGVKGFKVDFMDRDDQPMMDFYRRAAQVAAKYHLMIDFHGACKPTGLQRTYPNIVNYEGVYGLENVKGRKEEKDFVTYEVTIPFVRLVAGAADYTQGAMRNATKKNFRYVSSEGMSQGTRCRQLAEYVIFDSPLSMLCDSPSNYKKEQECLQFIADVPTTWDETRALEGKAGEYVAMARRKGSTWYIGAITNWDARELTLDLSFIEGEPLMEIFRDGANAHRAARDFKQDWKHFPADGKITVKMAPGGGWAAVLRTEPLPWEKTDKDWAKYSYYADKNAAVKSRPKAVLFGDSITRNWWGKDRGWLEEHNYEGRGIGGQTTTHLLSRIRPDVIALQPEYMVLLIGTNDLARNNGYISVENTFGNIVSLVQLAQSNGIKPVMCTLCPAREYGWRKRVGDARPMIEQLNAMITAYAKENGIPLVDYYSVLSTPDGALDPRYADDSVHPNLQGYKVMEKALLDVMEKLD